MTGTVFCDINNNNEMDPKYRNLTKEERECVLRVRNYFIKEKDNFGPLEDVRAVQRKAADALDVSEATVSRTVSASRNGENLNTQKRKRMQYKCRDLPATVKVEIKDVIYDMFAKKEHVTLDSLLAKIKEKQICDMSRATLGRVLKHLGFCYKATDNRRGLCEQSHVVAKRHKFLRLYLKNRNSPEPRQVVFIDETWVFSKGSSKKTWQDDSVKSLQQPTKTSDGKRYIIVHAGTENGFLEGASFIFGTKNKSLDYHDNMNAELFEKWFEENVLKHLEEPSIIVLDNASYHSRIIDKVLTLQ